MTKNEIERFLRLWVAEGIPFAFSIAPMIYEAVREWLAKILNIHTKHITIIGSGRIGYSMAPQPFYGKPFSSNSDLDFTIVSYELFYELCNTFNQWKQDVSQGHVKPRNDEEDKYWKVNLYQVVPNTIRRGFIDANKLPNIYPLTKLINNTRWLLGEKLKLTPKCPQFTKVSFRIYKDLTSFVNQLWISFYKTVQSFSKIIG